MAAAKNSIGGGHDEAVFHQFASWNEDDDRYELTADSLKRAVMKLDYMPLGRMSEQLLPISDILKPQSPTSGVVLSEPSPSWLKEQMAKLDERRRPRVQHIRDLLRTLVADALAAKVDADRIRLGLERVAERVHDGRALLDRSGLASRHGTCARVQAAV